MKNLSGQSNTTQGLISFRAGEDLADKNGYIARVDVDTDGEACIKLATHASHRAAYVIIDGDDKGKTVSVLPLSPDRQIRAK